MLRLDSEPALLQSKLCPAQDGWIDILGIRVRDRTLPEATELLCDVAERRAGQQFAFVNPDCLNIACRDRDYRRCLGEIQEVWGDGVGLQLAGRMLVRKLKDNVNGTDMFPLLCERAAARGLSIFLLGARPGVARAAADAMQEANPDLVIAGVQHGYFNEEEEAEVIERIAESKAHVLLVAFGAPRQDLWIAKHRKKLKVGAAVGVGGLFDFYSGRIQRAPKVWRKVGLEWCWRMLQEPGRMWRRYILGNPLFLERVAAQRGREIKAVPRARWKRLRWCFQRWLGPRLKRSFDVLASGSAILLASPLLILMYTAVRLDSPGPAFFSQVRIGRGGRPFRVWKFRSMYTDAEERKRALEEKADMSGGIRFKMKSDPRVTRVGKLLRMSSLDELPQLYNILKGDMSLVGPRPPIPQEVAEYNLRERRRLDGVPGLTCIWQVSGRSDIPFDQQVEMDLDYLGRRSVWLDIALMFRTIPAVLFARGAY